MRDPIRWPPPLPWHRVLWIVVLVVVAISGDARRERIFWQNWRIGRSRPYFYVSSYAPDPDLQLITGYESDK